MRTIMIVFVCTLVACLLSFALGFREPTTEALRGIKYWIVDTTFRLWYSKIDPFLDRVRAARAATPKRDSDNCVILVPREAGPVVESNQTKYPVPITQVPIRSTKADAKREAWKYAEKLAGREMSWKAARKFLNKLEREGRALAAAATCAEVDA